MKISRPIILAVLVAVFVVFVGNYHFIHGRTVSWKKVPKVSWSLSETFINMDEVAGTPPLLLRAKYPLFIQSMEAAQE